MTVLLEHFGNLGTPEDSFLSSSLLGDTST